MTPPLSKSATYTPRKKRPRVPTPPPEDDLRHTLTNVSTTKPRKTRENWFWNRDARLDVLLDSGEIYNSGTGRIYSKTIDMFSAHDITGLTSNQKKRFDKHIAKGEWYHRYLIDAVHFKQRWISERELSLRTTTALEEGNVTNPLFLLP